jgi:hypothetical protein
MLSQNSVYVLFPRWICLIDVSTPAAEKARAGSASITCVGTI